MPTLLDAARQAAAPPADETPPELLRRPRAPTLLDVAQQAPPPPPPDQGAPPQTATTITPTTTPPSPPDQPRGPGPWRGRYRFSDDEEPPPPPPPEQHPATTITPTTERPPGPWAKGYEYADPNAVREPTWGETIGLTAARVVPPIAAGATVPVLGPAAVPAAGLAATLGDIYAQRYEKEHGLRREVRPYESIVSGVTGMIPGAEASPEVALGTRMARRAMEGATINLGADVARKQLEGEPISLLDIAQSVGMGAAWGGAAGAGEHGVNYVLRRPEMPALDTRPIEEQFPVGSDIHYDSALTGQRERGTVSEHWTNPETGQTHVVAQDANGVPAIAHDPQHMPTPPAEETPTGAPPAPMETVKPPELMGPPEPPPGHVRVYHAGADPALGGPRWVHPDEQYVRDFRPGADVYYTDIPESSPLLRKAYDDTGVSPPAPYLPFEMPEELTPTLRPVEGGRGDVAPPLQAPPPEGPPAPLAEGQPAEEPAPLYQQPVFRRAPGLHEAVSGEEIPGAREPGPERLERQHAAVDRLFSDHPPETRQILKDMLTANADDIAERGRQTQPVERSRALADELIVDPEQLWKRGKGAPILTAEQKLSVLNLIKSQMGQVSDLQAARDALPADAPPAARDAAELRIKIKNQELALTVAAAQGDISETGRAMNILKYQVRQLDTGDPKFIRAALREGVPVDKIATIIHQIPEDDFVGRYRNLLALRKPQTWTQRGLSYMTTNILSGPVTPIRKTLADAWAVAHDFAVTPFAAAWERVAPERWGGTQPGERQTYASELRTRAAAFNVARPDAWKRMMSVIKEGFTPEQAESYAATRRELFEKRGPVLRGIVNYSSRALAAAETYSKTLVEHMELAGSAYTAARNEGVRQGLSGAELEHFIPARAAELVKDPQFHSDALKYAERRVYREKGVWDTALIRLGQDIPAFRYIMPLVRIPIALFRQGVQHSPAGFFTKLGRAEGRLGAQARGEALLGTLVGAWLMHKALNDELDGSGPSNPSDFRAWWDAGHRPNSIKIGPYRIGHHVLPWSLEASMIGNMRDTYKDLIDKGDDVGALQLISMFGRRQAKSLLQQSTIRNLADFTQGIGDTDEATFNRFTGSLMTGFIPGSGLLRGVKRAVDPISRKATTPWEYVESAMPGLSTRLEPKLGAKGEELRSEQPGGAAGRMLLPMEISTDQPDPLRDELRRIGVPRLTIPAESKIGPHRLTPEERTAIGKAKGQATVNELNRLFDSPSYQRIPDTEQGRAQQARAAKGTIGRTRTRIARQAAGLVARGQPITLDALLPNR